MKLQKWKTLYLILALPLLCSATANAFKFPKIPKIPGVGTGVKIPGLDDLLKREPALTTSLADTVPEIPYLDDYNPKVFSPLVEVPRDGNTDFLRYPGVYEFYAQSYCLHAGSYGPRSGNGYLYAPLKGKRAGIIDNILRNSVKHPELPQKNIQLLIWGVLAESKVDKMPDKLQETAKTLLTKKEISSLSSKGLDKLPPEISSKVKANMPPLARMAFDAKNQLRGMLSSQTLPAYSAMEEVAVLSGDPPAELRGENEVDVPSGRWSYHPNGYFIRMLPTSYPRTTVHIYEPETFDIERDDQGRILRITDPRGNIIESTYADGAASNVNDDNLQGWAFSSVRFMTPGDAAHPGVPQEKTWTNKGWAWTGDATGEGNIASQGAPFTDAESRYQSVQKYRTQMDALNENLNRNKYQEIAVGSVGSINLSNLAHYRAALQQLTATTKDAWIIAQVNMVTNVWQSALQSELESSKRAAAAPGVPKVLFQHVGFQQVRQLQQFGGGQPSGGFGGGGAGMPGSSGRQRLAQSSRPAPKKGGEDAIDKAKKATGRMGNANDVITIVTDGPKGFVGGWIPGMMFGEILDFIFDTGRKVTDALSMDPPRDDFNIYAMPEKFTVPQVAPSATLSVSRAQAWNNVMDTSVDLLANLRAAHISVDRHGGALRANDAKWTYNQGAAIVHYKKEVGVLMIALANRLDKLIEVSKAENIDDPVVSAEQMRAYQQRLQAQGFTKEELEAAQMIGLNETDLAQIKEERLAADPQRVNGENMESALSEMSIAIRRLGIHLNSLPPIQLPTNTKSTKQASTLMMKG